MLLRSACAPLAVEGGSLCLANWKEFMGISATVRTPVLDSMTESSCRPPRTPSGTRSRPSFRRIPWDPKMVLPAAALVMAVAMLMLRR